MPLRSIIVLASALISCSAAEVALPDGIVEDARFFAFDPRAVPACGPAGDMPARGRLPALGPLTAEDGVFLLAFDPGPVAALYGDRDAVPVQKITERGFDDGFDVVELAPPNKVWRVEGGAFVEAEPPEDALLAMVTPTACAPRLADRCAKGSIDAACAQFEEIVDVFIPEAIERGVGVVLPLDRDHALVGARPSQIRPQERFFIADATRTQAVSIGAPDDLAHLAAYRRAAEEPIYLYGPRGALARGTPNLDFSTLFDERRCCADAEAAWIDGPRDATAPFELFALDTHGFFERYDGENWTQLTGALPAPFESPHGGVAWISPGEAIAAGSRISDVLRYRDGVLHIESFTNGSDDRATAIAVVPGIGTVIGTTRGALYADAGDGNWIQLASPLDNRPVHGISPFGDGFVFGRSLPTGSGGQIAEWVPGHGLCDSVRVTDRDVLALHPIEDGFVVYSKDVSTDPFVGFVRRKNGYPECAGPAD